MAIPGRVYRARGKGLGIGDRCSIGQCPPQPDPVGLGVRGLEAQGRGCPGFFIYFYFLLFVSLPSCSSACIRRTDFPSQELSRLFSFIRGLRDGGEHRKHWGGSQDAPMASPFTLTPQSGVWTSKPFGFGQILQKISLCCRPRCKAGGLQAAECFSQGEPTCDTSPSPITNSLFRRKFLALKKKKEGKMSPGSPPPHAGCATQITLVGTRWGSGREGAGVTVMVNAVGLSPAPAPCPLHISPFSAAFEARGAPSVPL